MIILLQLIYLTVEHYLSEMQKRFIGRGRARGAVTNVDATVSPHQSGRLSLHLKPQQHMGRPGNTPNTITSSQEQHVGAQHSTTKTVDESTHPVEKNSVGVAQSQSACCNSGKIMPGGYSDSEDDLDEYAFSCDYDSNVSSETVRPNAQTIKSQAGSNHTVSTGSTNAYSQNVQADHQKSGSSASQISHEEWLASILSNKSRAARAQLNERHVNEYWQLQVHSLWNNTQKRFNAMSGLLQQAFEAVTNPYDLALYMIEKSRDYSKGKTNTLSYTVATQFEKWIQRQGKEYSAFLDKDLRIKAFDLSTRSVMNMFTSIAKSFQFHHRNNEYLLPFIKNFLENKKYKEAAVCVAKTGLHDHFDIHDILVPLLLQDKLNLVEEYVYRRKAQQVELVQLLDHLCNPETSILEFVQNNKVSGIKMDKLQPKVLSKLAIRLMKLYQIPQDMCPNINNKRGLGGLRYLMYKKYIECTLDVDGFDDLIKDTVADNDFLKTQLIDLLTSYNDFEAAARWARHYNLPTEQLPYQVVNAIGSLDLDAANADLEEEDWEADNQAQPYIPSIYHHQLQLPLEAIHHISTQEQFIKCMELLSQPDTVVGMDAEWRPSIMQSKPTGMALLQLANASQVFLLDMPALKSQLQDTDWLHMAQLFWCNNNSLKIGYGFDSDIKVLTDTIPVLRHPLKKIQRMVDLQWLNSQILGMCPDFYEKSHVVDAGHLKQDQGADPEEDWGDEPYEFKSAPSAIAAEDVRVIKSEEKGLSELVRLSLGKPLDKSQQMTNWELRPLRQAQVIYASLDAYCLLEVYNVMKSRVTQLDLHIDLEPEVAGKVPAASHRSRLQRQQDRVKERPGGYGKNEASLKPQLRQPKPDVPETNASELAVVCDTMLQGLGRQLRACGVDVRILENTEDHDKAAEIARRENRIILTSGTPFYTLKSQVPQGMCYSVPAGKAKDQLEDVLNRFNVKVTQRDIFSRCQVCNGNKYLFVSPASLRAAKRKKEQLLKDGQVGTLMQPARGSAWLGASSTGSPLDRNLVKQTQRAAAMTTVKDDPAMQSYQKGSVGFASADSEMFDDINMDTISLDNGCPIKVETVPYPIIGKVKIFYICATCGKVFWEGGHLARVTNQYKHLLKEEEGSENGEDPDKDNLVQIDFSSSATGLHIADSSNQ